MNFQSCAKNPAHCVTEVIHESDVDIHSRDDVVGHEHCLNEFYQLQMNVLIDISAKLVTSTIGWIVHQSE
jgi:hypothetical protein